MKAILFGSNGQDGFYLKKLLNQNNIEVIPVNRPMGPDDTDIADFNSVASLIKQNKPEFIFHFAAISSTKHDIIFENEKVISLGTINILEAVKRFSPDSRVFISGSGLQFENKGYPISEANPFEARDPYSVSRIHSTYAARYYRKLGLNVYIGYFFNHDSPRRTEQHVAKKITEFVKRLNDNINSKLIIGNIDVIKEWTYAGDMVDAVYKLVNQTNIYEAVLGSGEGYSIKHFLEICFKIVGTNWQNHITVDENFIPTSHKLISDPSLIHSLGWSPKVTISQLAEMMINDSEYESN